MRKQSRKAYYNNDWPEFSAQVQKRDGHKCLRCGRTNREATLQTHHTVYKPGLQPWDYPLSDCITLCKGCHAKEHNLIEPDSGWTLVAIEDLGDLIGVCERKGCGNEIRYEHITYHPYWGYKSVGSTCIEHLTREDKFVSHEVLQLFKKISDFVHGSYWERGQTKKGKEFQYTTHAHHQIRIYGEEFRCSFQVVIKEKGERWYDYGKVIRAHGKNLNQVKELSYIVLKGLTTQKESRKSMLRSIYKRLI